MKNIKTVKKFRNLSGEIFLSINNLAIDPFIFNVEFLVNGKIEKGFSFDNARQANKKFNHLAKLLQLSDLGSFPGYSNLVEIN